MLIEMPEDNERGVALKYKVLPKSSWNLTVACKPLVMYTWSANSYLMYVLFAVCVNSSFTIAEEMRLVTMCKVSHIFVSAHHIPLSSDCHECMQLLIVFEGSITNSHQDCLCTSHTFSDFQYHFRIARMTTIPPPFSLSALPIFKVAFERILHYTLCISFRFNFENIHRQLLLKCACIFWAPP
jgi:hypothetical protein